MVMRLQMKILTPLVFPFLLAFLQMTGVTREKCLALIQRYEVSDEGRQKGYLGIDGEFDVKFSRGTQTICKGCECRKMSKSNICILGSKSSANMRGGSEALSIVGKKFQTC